jgi:hypothetical protein
LEAELSSPEWDSDFPKEAVVEVTTEDTKVEPGFIGEINRLCFSSDGYVGL